MKRNTIKTVVAGLILVTGFNAFAMQEDLGDELYEALHHKSLDELLINVVKKKEIEKVRILLDNGAYVNAQDEYGRTPLFIAASEGHRDIAKLLIKRKAKVNATDRLGRPIIHIAAENGFPEICRDLIEHGANANAKGLLFVNPFLQDAVRANGMTPDIYADIQANGTTPLMEAARNGNVPVITALLTTVSRKEVLENFPALIAIQHAQPLLPPDMRRKISQAVIDKLVRNHMRKVREMINTKSHNHTTSWFANRDNEAEIIHILDLSNPASFEQIRSQVEANIKRILGKRPATQEAVIEEVN